MNQPLPPDRIRAARRAHAVPGAAAGTAQSRRTLAIRAAIVAVVAALGYAAFIWWSTHWQPARATWPVQGVAVGSANQPLSWPGLATQGANFAYVDAIVGGTRAEPNFSVQLDAARAAGLRVGAIHHFSLCSFASDQAAAFVRLVPRDPDALPPAVILDIDPACTTQPTRALVVSELSTFLNQIETHMDKPAMIAPSSDFEARYAITSAINRAVWTNRNWRAPSADGPRWVIWQANDALRVTGSTGPTRWLVLHDGGPDGISAP